MKRYIINILLSLDQFINTILLGDPDDSISGRCGRAMQSGNPEYWVPFVTYLIDTTAYWLSGEVAHCINSITPKELLPYEKWSWERKINIKPKIRK